jgi:hypothetical protein
MSEHLILLDFQMTDCEFRYDDTEERDPSYSCARMTPHSMFGGHSGQICFTGEGLKWVATRKNNRPR